MTRTHNVAQETKQQAFVPRPASAWLLLILLPAILLADPVEILSDYFLLRRSVAVRGRRLHMSWGLIFANASDVTGLAL